MTYPAILDGLDARFQTLTMLSADRLLRHQPRSITTFPLLYSLFDRMERGAEGRAAAGQINKNVYYTLHRLVLYRLAAPGTGSPTENDALEAALPAWINALPAAVDADPRLGGALNGNGAAYLGGMARIVDATGAWVTIGGSVYRVVDFVSEVFEKFAYRAPNL